MLTSPAGHHCFICLLGGSRGLVQEQNSHFLAVSQGAEAEEDATGIRGRGQGRETTAAVEVGVTGKVEEGWWYDHQESWCLQEPEH